LEVRVSGSPAVTNLTEIPLDTETLGKIFQPTPAVRSGMHATISMICFFC
jgi:hypothetical protein